MNENVILNYNLFDGDFGNQDDKVLKNKIVTTRKKHEKACHICMGDILKFELSRVETDIFEGKIETYRVCHKCCEAISYDYENNCEDKLDKRYKIGHDIRRRNSHPA